MKIVEESRGCRGEQGRTIVLLDKVAAMLMRVYIEGKLGVFMLMCILGAAKGDFPPSVWLFL